LLYTVTISWRHIFLCSGLLASIPSFTFASNGANGKVYAFVFFSYLAKSVRIVLMMVSLGTRCLKELDIFLLM
jgi:hypothetical protein